MRVIAVVTDAYGGYGGIARACCDVLEAIATAPECERVDVFPRVSGRGPENIPAKIIQHRAVHGRVAYTARCIAAGRDGADLVFCNHLFMAPAAFAVAKLTKAKLVVQLHGIEVWEEPSTVQRHALEAADQLWCVSRYTRSKVLDFIDIPAERVIVINNTYEPRFKPGDRHAARARFNVTDGPILLTVGRLDPRERYKGHDRVIRALPEVLSAYPNLQYLIAGDGDDEARLKTEVEILSVGNAVRFLGRVTHLDLPDLYRAADLFVLPSTGEGFGIVFLEAMASGTPVLGECVAGASDALGDGELGQCIGTDGLAIGIIGALGKARRDELPERVRERFGPDRFSAEIRDSLVRML